MRRVRFVLYCVLVTLALAALAYWGETARAKLYAKAVAEELRK